MKRYWKIENEADYRKVCEIVGTNLLSGYIEGIKCVGTDESGWMQYSLLGSGSFLTGGYTLCTLDNKQENTMEMTKTEALKQIDKLRAFIEAEDKKPTPLAMTQKGDGVRLNGNLAMNIYDRGITGGNRLGAKASGHFASAFLYSDEDGQWFDKDGEKIEGHLFYKPAGE